MKLTRHVVYTPKDRVRLIERRIRNSVCTAEIGWLRGFMVRRVLVGVPDRDDEDALRAVYDWVERNIRYIPDPVNYDLYPSAKAVVAMRCGDCDCHTILVCSMLAAIGFVVGCRNIQERQTGQYHIYPIVGLPVGDTEDLVPVDTAWHGATGAGQEYPENQTSYRQDWLFQL